MWRPFSSIRLPGPDPDCLDQRGEAVVTPVFLACVEGLHWLTMQTLYFCCLSFLPLIVSVRGRNI